VPLPAVLRRPEVVALGWQCLDHPPLGDQAISDEQEVGRVIVERPATMPGVLAQP
jgi:hypothetical protein